MNHENQYSPFRGLVVWLTGLDAMLKNTILLADTFESSPRYENISVEQEKDLLADVTDDADDLCKRLFESTIVELLNNQGFLSERYHNGFIVHRRNCTNLLITNVHYSYSEFQSDLHNFHPDKVLFARAPKGLRQDVFIEIARDFNMAFIRQQVPQIFNHKNPCISMPHYLNNDNGDSIPVPHFNAFALNIIPKNKRLHRERIERFIGNLISGIIGGIFSPQCTVFQVSLFNNLFD